MFKFYIFLFCVVLYVNTCAQCVDSLFDSVHKVHAVEVIVPSCMIACGAATTFCPNVSSVNFVVKDWTQEEVKISTEIDNYLQWTPTAAEYVLNVCGVKGVHRYGDLTALSTLSHLLGWGVNSGVKYSTKTNRPDGSAHNSFASGHTMTAFVGAEIIRREFGRQHPWIAVGGYAVAATTAFLRISNNRHWLGDVLAGAGIGMLSTSLVYWVYPYLRSAFTSSKRCKGYVFYGEQGLQIGATLQLGKTLPNQLTAFPDFTLADGQGRGNAEGSVAE